LYANGDFEGVRRKTHLKFTKTILIYLDATSCFRRWRPA
jgi:hypothetical protein